MHKFINVSKFLIKIIIFEPLKTDQITLKARLDFNCNFER